MRNKSPQALRKAPPFQEKILHFQEYPNHVALQTAPNCFFIFLLSHEEAGDAISCPAGSLVKCETLAEATEVIRQMHEYEMQQRPKLLIASAVPSPETIRLLNRRGERLH